MKDDLELAQRGIMFLCDIQPGSNVLSRKEMDEDGRETEIVYNVYRIIWEGLRRLIELDV